MRKAQENTKSESDSYGILWVIGAGAASGGAMDASNLLKPVLASGEIRCIFEHRSHSKVGLVRTQHSHAIAAGHVVQFQAHAGVGLGEAFDHLWQEIKNGGFPGSDIDLSAVEIPQFTGEGFRDAINTLLI